MKRYLYLFLASLALTGLIQADQINEEGTYWQCSTQDNTNIEWVAKSSYQKVALNMAFAACKRESRDPASCKTSSADCEGFHLGLSTKAMWRCTALDKAAFPWRSNLYTHPEDAALAAKAYCKANSTIPETCYINMVTCMNITDRESL